MTVNLFETIERIKNSTYIYYLYQNYIRIFTYILTCFKLNQVERNLNLTQFSVILSEVYFEINNYIV